MGCFGCAGRPTKKVTEKNENQNSYIKFNTSNSSGGSSRSSSGRRRGSQGGACKVTKEDDHKSEIDQISEELRSINLEQDGRPIGKRAKSFKFSELAVATNDFSSDCFLGEGGFGKVYKGHIDRINQDVAIKQLDLNGHQGTREFVVEVLTLSLADHPNLVKLLGFCVDGDQRLLVYEYMPLGSLENHLYDLAPNQKPLDWNTRMKIAAGAAKGLEYLHDKMKPPVIYRDLKCSNILLGEGYHPKLSDFGLAKVGPTGNKTHVSTRVMGTYGYCAPDYAMTGQLTFKSDIYSFGVVLLELITGRKAFDHRRTGREQNLVSWARPLFKDRKKFSQMADPALQGQFPMRGLYQALAIAAMCIQEKPSMRPVISDVVNALNYLASQTYAPRSRSGRNSRRSGTSSGESSLLGSPSFFPEEKSDDDERTDAEQNEGGRLITN